MVRRASTSGLSVLLVLLVTQLSLCQTAVRPAGSGTPGNPFQIDSLSNLYWITQNPPTWDSCFVQTSDIDASTSSTWDSDSGFLPIGSGSTVFSGTYDGQHHTITGLTIERGTTTRVGMFSTCYGGTIKNLGLVNETVVGDEWVGGLVGQASIGTAPPYFSTIDSCYTGGRVLTSASSTSETYIGGFVGENYACTISHSYSTVNVATVDGNGTYVGGFVGHNSGASTEITYCYNTGTVSLANSAADDVGGFVGYNENSAQIDNCYSAGSYVEGYDYVGGFVGVNYSGAVISNCYCRDNVNGSGDVGGFVGYNYGTSTQINDCYSTGTVSPSVFGSGGFVAYNSIATVNNSFWDEQTSGLSSSAGGTGLPTVGMKFLSNFTNAGWDFVLETTNGTNDTWDMDTTNKVINNGYPFLAWQNGGVVALPVEMTSFAATASGLTANLQWTTATEVNTSGWEIQRRAIANFGVPIADWVRAGFVKGAGTSTSPQQYSFVDRDLSAGTYSYRLKQVDKNGSVRYSETVNVEVGTAPRVFTLSQNYPNPFNPTTTIEFTLEKDGRVSLKVYDILGREVATLLDENRKAGEYQQVVFDGSRFSSGVYVAVLRSGGTQLVRKMLMVK